MILVSYTAASATLDIDCCRGHRSRGACSCRSLCDEEKIASSGTRLEIGQTELLSVHFLFFRAKKGLI